MAKNVMKLIKPSPTLGKNAFDLSHRSVFSINAGQILPSFFVETVPNDKIVFNAADLLRAAPMVTSPFLRAKQHIDFWFVPYQALWSRWNDFITSRSEPNSSRLLGYDFCPHVRLRDLLETLYNQYTGGFTADIVGMDYLKTACKILDMCGIPCDELWKYACDHTYTFDKLNIPTVSVNLFRLAAYNFIWYKEYRQQYYDDGIYGLQSNMTSYGDIARLWNFDYLPCVDSTDSDLMYDTNVADIITAMCQMRYRCWKKDLLTGLLPNTQFGAVSSLKINLDNTNFNVGRADGSNIPPGSVLQTQSSSTSNPVVYAGTPVSGQSLKLLNGSSTFDILYLRRSEAIQKWREATLRAGNQIEDNYEAHFGSKPNSHMLSHPHFIGSYDAPLNISDVNATSQTGAAVNGAVGSIAGKGISSLDDKKFEFSTNDFGVIVGMFSLLPESEYMSSGIDRNNQLLEQFDFFMPEFENLGLEAVSCFNWLSSTGSQRVLGYAPRYYGYKQYLDKVHLGFYPNESYHHWVTPKSDVTSALAGPNPIPLSLLYVNPAILDTIFASGVANEDQFIVDMFNDVTAIRSMSVSGMPSY